MQALQTNLDGKSKQYRDPALTHLFLMNNIHYMVRSVRRFVVLNFSQSSQNITSSPCGQVSVCNILFSDQKPRTYQGMTGFKGIEGLCSNMQTNTKGLVGQRCCSVCQLNELPDNNHTLSQLLLISYSLDILDIWGS